MRDQKKAKDLEGFGRESRGKVARWEGVTESWECRWEYGKVPEKHAYLKWEGREGLLEGRIDRGSCCG